LRCVIPVVLSNNNYKLMVHMYIVKNTTIFLIVKSSPVTVLEWPRGFQDVKVPRFHDNGTG